jgi:chemotaxis protein CheD
MSKTAGRSKPRSSGATGGKEHIVRVADWAVEAEGVLVTLGLGSCVAIMIHDPARGVGGMAHVLLPSHSLSRDQSNPAKFPETAVPLLLQRLVAVGADPKRLVAKLAGGASMFSQLMTPGSIQMGERNIAASRAALRRAGIPIAAEAVGGDKGRSVRFHVSDGRVETRTVGGDERIL